MVIKNTNDPGTTILSKIKKSLVSTGASYGFGLDLTIDRWMIFPNGRI